MNLGKVAHILAGFALFFSLFQGIPLLFSVLAEEGSAEGVRPVQGFVAAIGVGLLVSLLLWLGGRGAKDDFFRRESLAVVGLAWLLAGALGALPFIWSGAMASSVDAVFESVSGLTTTGASILGGPNTAIEDLPQSVLLWRAMLQWMGGLGIILVFIVLLPAMGVTGKNLLSSEQVGISSESVRPRMQKQARALFLLYVILTVAEVLLLKVVGAEWFDSVCHAFTTMATGGFSTKNYSIGSYHSAGIEIVTIVFMFLAGCNFMLLLAAASRRGATLGTFFSNPEFRVYVGLTLGLIVAVTIILRVWGYDMPDASTANQTRDYSSMLWCFRDASFQVVSILTSTGFGTADFQNWPKPALLILMFCMLVGGCSGSTAGGIKVLRLIVSFKLVIYAVRHYLRPKSVEKVRVGHEVVSNSIISAILALILMWIGTIAVGAFALALDPRLDMLSAVSASLSMTGCTGPALTEVTAAFEPANAGGINLGPLGGYGDLAGISKLLLCLQMILGRLEILALLVFLFPGLWRR